MKTKEYNSVLITGSIAYDQIMDFPKKFIDYIQPNKLHQLNVAFVVNKLEKQIGGIATNIAYNISINTNKKITILGAVGKDGANILRFMRKNNINTSHIYFDKNKFSSTGVVFTDIKDNQIWGYYYGAGEYAKKAEFPEVDINKTLFHIASSHPVSFIYFQKKAIKMDIDYLYDPGMLVSGLNNNQIKEGVLNCRWLIGNDYEVALITKKINTSVNQLIKKGIKVITTLGEKGVVYQSETNKSLKINAYKVKKVVDPTGAGDAWRGGFIAGLLENKTLIECLKLGNIMASFAIEKYGTVNHKPTQKEINERLYMI